MLLKDIWRYHIAKFLSPLDVAYLRATSRFFRQSINDVAVNLRTMTRSNIVAWAAIGGHQDVIDLMIDEGAKDWNAGRYESGLVVFERWWEIGRKNLIINDDEK